MMKAHEDFDWSFKKKQINNIYKKYRVSKDIL